MIQLNSIYYFGSLVTCKARGVVDRTPREIASLLRFPPPSVRQACALFDECDAAIEQVVLAQIKKATGVYLYVKCIHDIYHKPLGALILAIDSLFHCWIVHDQQYNSKANPKEAAATVLHEAVDRLVKEGVCVNGVIHAEEPCSGEVLAQMTTLFPGSSDGVLPLILTRNSGDGWMGDLSGCAAYQALAWPVIDLVDVIVRNELYRTTVEKAVAKKKME